MTEDLEEGNLISKTETFLSFVVLASWKDSITVLQSCEPLSPWPENLQIVRRSSESIAWRACTDPRAISWPLTGHGGIGKAPNNSPLLNDLKSELTKVPHDWWFEDVSNLCIDYFAAVITAIKAKGMASELAGAAVVRYALKWLPGLCKEKTSKIQDLEQQINLNGELHMIIVGGKDDSTVSQNKNCMLLERIVSILPPQKDAASCGFVLHLLQMASLLNASDVCKKDLEGRVAMQLEQATLSDLLIPSFGDIHETLYNVDLVQQIVELFSMQEQALPPSPVSFLSSERLAYDGMPSVYVAPHGAKMKVAKLIDSYLAEIGRDKNLSLTAFQALAEALPEYARACDDGLYRAIDTYLKAHPGMSDAERKKLCQLMDCQKLSIDACLHVAQNERLPLRVVVQVLFCEQVKLSNAITGNVLTREQRWPICNSQGQQFTVSLSENGTQPLHQDNWSTAHQVIKAIQLDVQKMKAQFSALQIGYTTLQQQLERVSKGKNAFPWSSGWKKFSKNVKAPQFLHRRLSIDETATNATDVPLTPSMTDIHKPRRWRNSIS